MVAPAVIHGDRDRLLGFDAAEHPLAVQLGGSDPEQLAEAARICADYGYDEINLNVGCPSDRVQSGKFGACLMAEPELVADCVRAMRDATDRPVTVKCRIGIDDQDSEDDLRIFVDHMLEAEVDALYVHARKAWLKGLSPKENREVPPLDYDRVYRLKKHVGDLPLMINGGIETLKACHTHLQHVDGVMLGRAAYHNPGLLRDVDEQFFNDETASISLESLCEVMMNYAEIKKDDNSVTIYPNPNSGNISLQFNKTYTSLDISVIDILGNEVQHQKLKDVDKTNLTLDIADGWYLIEVYNEYGTIHRQKILKK